MSGSFFRVNNSSYVGMYVLFICIVSILYMELNIYIKVWKYIHRKSIEHVVNVNNSSVLSHGSCVLL